MSCRESESGTEDVADDDATEPGKYMMWARRWCLVSQPLFVSVMLQEVRFSSASPFKCMN